MMETEPVAFTLTVPTLVLRLMVLVPAIKLREPVEPSTPAPERLPAPEVVSEMPPFAVMELPMTIEPELAIKDMDEAPRLTVPTELIAELVELPVEITRLLGSPASVKLDTPLVMEVSELMVTAVVPGFIVKVP